MILVMPAASRIFVTAIPRGARGPMISTFEVLDPLARQA